MKISFFLKATISFVISSITILYVNITYRNICIANDTSSLLESAFEKLYEGDPDSAIEYLNKAISLGDTNPGTYSCLGTAYSQKGDQDSAIEYLNKAISLDDKNPSAYFSLGIIYSSREDGDYTKEKLEILNKLEQLDKSLAEQFRKEINF